MSGEIDWLRGTPQPLVGSAKIFTEPWEETALANRRVFELALRDVGLPEQELDEVLALRDEVAVDAKTLDDRIDAMVAVGMHWDDPAREVRRERESVVARLRSWMGGRSFRVEAQEDVQVRIPLFVLAAAELAGCTASITTIRQRWDALLWSVTIFGTGLGDTANISVSSSSKFTASDGEVKVVFLPAEVRVEKGTLVKGARSIGTGYRIDAAHLRTTGAPGLLLLSAGARPPAGKLAERYPLSGDTSGAVATYEYTYERSTSSNLGVAIKAFNVDIGVNATIGSMSSLVLTYDLVSGLDYELHRLRSGEGLVWAPVAQAGAKARA
jgi:hypothetical protein